MKQCPNPNCIYYTRLEELPDAYVRCPACGGQLVDSALNSGVLRSGHLPKVSALPSRDLDQEFEQAFGDENAPPVAQAVVTGTTTTDTGPYGEGEYDPYYASTEYEAQYGGPRPLSRLGRLGYIAGALLLVAACGLFVFVMATRILPQPSAVTGVQATQTAIAAIRPAVNTPISELPTANSLPTSAPPTSPPPPAQPTDTPLPNVEPPPTAEIPPTATTPPPPAPTAQPNSTAPPAQTQPTGGILEAFMTGNIQGGQSSLDTISVYDPSATFVMAVEAQFGDGGVTSITTRWYGPDNGLLYELPRNFAQPGTYYSSFTLSKNTPWLEGAYRVDIYTNGASTSAYSVSFSVSP